MRRIYLFLLFIPIIACQDSKKDFNLNVPQFKDATPILVEEMLGKPDSSYHRKIFGKRYFIQLYDSHKTEFRHLQGSLEGIILNEPFEFPFEPETITEFGFDYIEPSQMDTATNILWNNLGIIESANFYLVGEKLPEGVDKNFRIYFRMK